MPVKFHSQLLHEQRAGQRTRCRSSRCPTRPADPNPFPKYLATRRKWTATRSRPPTGTVPRPTRSTREAGRTCSRTAPTSPGAEIPSCPTEAWLDRRLGQLLRASRLLPGPVLQGRGPHRAARGRPRPGAGTCRSCLDMDDPSRTSDEEYAGMLFVHDLLRRPGRRAGLLHGPACQARARTELMADGSHHRRAGPPWLQEIADSGWVSLHYDNPALAGIGPGGVAGGGYPRVKMAWNQPTNRAIWSLVRRPVQRADADQGHSTSGSGTSSTKGMLRAYAELPKPVAVLQRQGLRAARRDRWPSRSAKRSRTQKRTIGAPPPKGRGRWSRTQKRPI